ncbi:MAG: hypothetical protein HDR55_03075 [Treponema sp.]|nr:hypothetical protein [Treponema sp.]
MKKTMLVFTLAAALSGACLFAKEAKNALLIANGEYSHFSGPFRADKGSRKFVHCA